MGLIAWLVDRRIAAYQGDLMEKHYLEVENIYRQMRGWRHDYHNHIQTMIALLDSPRGELEAYLRNLNDDLNQVDTVIKTGNVMVDAILNSKLSLAANRDISISAKAFVPPKTTISAIDLCVILGNLLDNAMEACVKVENKEDRFLRLYIDVMKGRLYISISNAAVGTPRREGGVFRTSKTEGMHGFGLARVDRIVERCGGYVERGAEEGVFATEVMLPL